MTRLAWWAALAALAAVAVFAQLDRASATRPQLAPLVPRPFRSVAQPPIAMAAMAGGDSQLAKAEAERLVQRRPLPAEHLFAIALADLRAGDLPGYARAFELSTERGWRAPGVQHAAARAALARGDAEAASNRVAALWALDASDAALPELTRALLSTPAAEAAFANRIAGTTVWQDTFLQRANEIADPKSAQRVIARAVRAGARFDCGLLVEFDHAQAAGAGCVAR